MILNSYLSEARLFFRYIRDWVLLLLVFTVFFFSFGIREVVLWGKSLTLPLPADTSFAAQLFNHMTADLIPEGVALIVTNPLAAFIAQIKIALLLAFLATLPFLIYRLVQYFAPALHRHERRAVALVSLSSAVLFALGAFFAYTVVIPPTFDILYTYTEGIGAAEFFTVNEFTGLVFALVLATGIMFLLPVGMALLSRIGVVPARFWGEQWRYAVVIFLVASAIITPDGSGITMVLLSAPMAGLYLIGCAAAQPMRSRKLKVES